MTIKAPGRAHRKGLTIIELFQLFPADRSAEKWFEEQRWPDGRFCPDCGSTRTVEVPSKRRMPYRCKSCHSYRKAVFMIDMPSSLRLYTGERFSGRVPSIFL